MKIMRIFYVLSLLFFIGCGIAVLADSITLMSAVGAVCAIVAVPTLIVLWYKDENRNNAAKVSPSRIPTKVEKRKAQLTGVAILIGVLLYTFMVSYL